MCGRYVLALRTSQVQRFLQEDHDLPVDEFPPDEGPGAPRFTYNFTPNNDGLVYRAQLPPQSRLGSVKCSWGRREIERQRQERLCEEKDPLPPIDNSYILDTMKWGLRPSNPHIQPGSDFAGLINCRVDSLNRGAGLWYPIARSGRRCVVIAQGFYEWSTRSSGGREIKIPHYLHRRDGALMCMAGLWNSPVFKDDHHNTNRSADTHWTQQGHLGSAGSMSTNDDGRKAKRVLGYPECTYTIITTESNAQISSLHHRMPVIFEPGSDAMRIWLDPTVDIRSIELEEILCPSQADFEVYPVTPDVGTVKNDSPRFIVPIDSPDNPANIANFFTRSPWKKEEAVAAPVDEPQTENRVGNDGNDSLDDRPNIEFEDNHMGVTDGKDSAFRSNPSLRPSSAYTGPGNIYQDSDTETHEHKPSHTRKLGPSKTPAKGRGKGNQKVAGNQLRIDAFFGK